MALRLGVLVVWVGRGLRDGRASVWSCAGCALAFAGLLLVVDGGREVAVHLEVPVAAAGQ